MTTRVEDLSQFGSALDDFPKGLMAKQAKVFLSELRHRYGTVRLLRMVVPIMRERHRLQKAHVAVMKSMKQDWGKGAVNEALIMSALFGVVVPIEGREGAYEVVKGIFQRIAPHSMVALYQSEDLANCAGDPFGNFKTFHMALFDASQHAFPNTQADLDDHFTSTVTRCSNVEVFTGFGCPELGKLGCDHDLAGYPVIADRHNFEFRRPCTIAKGSERCEFHFYRKGTAPDTEMIEGSPVLWTDSLNR